MSTTENATKLLQDLECGRREAYDELFSVIYDELRALARVQRRRVVAGETLNTTALVHELYLKLDVPANARWVSKAHFLAVAAKAIRHILLNYARDQAAQKRGGAWRSTTLNDSMMADRAADASGRAEILIDLNAALDRLARHSERLSRIVECRFFGGMSIEQTATALNLSTATVTRGWATAQAWLHRELEPGSDVRIA